jgi:hypothetical protein
LKLASAFDVGLQVDFVPFSRVLDGAIRLHSESFSVLEFEQDKGFFYSLSDINGASNTNISGAVSAGKLYQFPPQDTMGSAESAMTTPGSASSIAKQQLTA